MGRIINSLSTVSKDINGTTVSINMDSINSRTTDLSTYTRESAETWKRILHLYDF